MSIFGFVLGRQLFILPQQNFQDFEPGGSIIAEGDNSSSDLTLPSQRMAHEGFLRLTRIKADLLLKAQQLKALDRPSKRDYESVLSFMENDGGQLFEKDMGFIYEKEDLVTLRPGREYAWLDGLLERMLKVFRCKLIRYFFCPKETRDKTDDKDIHYYDRDRIATCVTMIITTIVLALLMIPIWLLYKFSVDGTIATSSDTIGVVLVFTLVFSAALSAFTKARRHEIIAASAGYCAVLVVFLGNVSIGQ